MTIETKFDNSEMAFFIHDNAIIKRPVSGISYDNGTVTYKFIVRKAATSLDKDSETYVEESRCFKSVKELCEYYETNLI